MTNKYQCDPRESDPGIHDTVFLVHLAEAYLTA
jgi:hypothetical protein